MPGGRHDAQGLEGSVQGTATAYTPQSRTTRLAIKHIMGGIQIQSNQNVPLQSLTMTSFIAISSFLPLLELADWHAILLTQT